MASCTEKVGNGTCMFEAKAGSDRCAVHDRCRICGKRECGRKRYRCEKCGGVICSSMTFDGEIYRNGKAHKRTGVWCGPVVEAA